MRRLARRPGILLVLTALAGVTVVMALLAADLYARGEVLAGSYAIASALVHAVLALVIAEDSI